MNPGKRSKLFGVRASLEDISFCFYSSRISIDHLMLMLLDQFTVKVFEAFSHNLWQINACTRITLTGLLRHLKNIGGKVARKRNCI